MECDFLIESEEWLKPFGYSVHSTNSEHTNVNFSNNDIYGNYPHIRCYIDKNGHKYCELTDASSYKYFLHLASGQLSFKHKDIEKYIKMFQYYGNLAVENPPF